MQTASGQVDVDRFEALVAEGRRALQAGDARAASERLREALALWRGPPLADFAYEPFAQGDDRDGSRRQRLAALEDRIDADLALGRARGRSWASWRRWSREHPLRERLQGQLMLALYRCGRQADALERYRTLAVNWSTSSGSSPAARCRSSSGRSSSKTRRSTRRRRAAYAPAGRRRARRRGGALLVAGGGALLLAAAIAAAVVALTRGGGSRLTAAANSVAVIDPQREPGRRADACRCRAGRHHRGRRRGVGGQHR